MLGKPKSAHITIERAKLEKVLEALEDPVLLNGVNNAKFFIRRALAQQEPVLGVVIREGLPTLLQERDIKPTDTRLYTSPPQRPWVGLTEDEMDKVRQSVGYNQLMSAGEYAKLVQFVTQAKLKEKNA